MNPDYGKVPEYITKVKHEIQEEYKIAAQLEEERKKQAEIEKLPPGMHILPEDERVELLHGLTERKSKIDKEYCGMPLAIDTEPLRVRYVS